MIFIIVIIIVVINVIIVIAIMFPNQKLIGLHISTSQIVLNFRPHEPVHVLLYEAVFDFL